MSGIIQYLFSESSDSSSPYKSSQNRKKSKKNKKKKLSEEERLLEEERYQEYLNRYFGKSYPDKELNTRSTKYDNYTWGLGAEHEMQLFHINRGSKDFGISNSNIIFDSQESTCLLLQSQANKETVKSTCCKAIPVESGKKCYHEHQEIKSKLHKIPKLDKKDIDYLKQVPWEYSGRQFKQCGGHLLKRIPVLMPEIITGNHKNRTIESICEELIFMENKFIELQMKNPFTKQKVRKYGELRQLPFGAIGNVKVPQRYTSHQANYKFSKEKYKDYLGSYHFTITLPFRPKTSNERFIKNHQNYGNQIQWIEPLLLTAFFSGDPENCISPNKKIARGSFRIMSTGWGNLAGSDLRVLTKKKGVGRYANVESHWRDYLSVESAKKLERCSDEWRIEEPRRLSQPVGILSSNIRTFGFIKNTKKCRKNYCFPEPSGCECPKVSGLNMNKPYGMEVRIFDHFNSKHLIVLLRILVYLAENSRVNECQGYVYRNKAWMKMVKGVMEDGWRAIATVDYIKELNKNLGLQLAPIETQAFALFEEVVKQLFDLHRDGLYSRIMLRDSYDTMPKIPQINRFSWQIQFNHKYSEKVKNYILNNFPIREDIPIKDFEKKFFKKFPKDTWKNNLPDVLFALEAKPHQILELELDRGFIKTVLLVGARS